MNLHLQPQKDVESQGNVQTLLEGKLCTEEPKALSTTPPKGLTLIRQTQTQGRAQAPRTHSFCHILIPVSSWKLVKAQEMAQPLGDLGNGEKHWTGNRETGVLCTPVFGSDAPVKPLCLLSPFSSKTKTMVWSSLGSLPTLMFWDPMVAGPQRVRAQQRGHLQTSQQEPVMNVADLETQIDEQRQIGTSAPVSLVLWGAEMSKDSCFPPDVIGERQCIFKRRIKLQTGILKT